MDLEIVYLELTFKALNDDGSSLIIRRVGWRIHIHVCFMCILFISLGRNYLYGVNLSARDDNIKLDKRV